MKFLSLIFLLLLLSACSKDYDSEYEEARNQILGTWELSALTETSLDGQILNSFTITEIVTFDSDGTGRKLNSFTGSRNLEWIYQLSPEKVSIEVESTESNSGFLISEENHHFDVIENDNLLQQWISNDNIFILQDSVLQFADREIKWQLIKQ